MRSKIARKSTDFAFAFKIAVDMDLRFPADIF